MAGLLDYISGSKLATALRQYVSDALPGGSLNPESKPVADRARYAAGLLDPNSQISRDTQQWHKKTQSGLTDLLRGKETPQADYAYNQMFNMVGMAPLGMTVWHGSPHRFDKFDMSKIGTGEGAQAYGHGLYMAEAPEVAKTYGMVDIGKNKEFRSVSYDGQTYPQSDAMAHSLFEVATKGRAPVISNLQQQADRLAISHPQMAQKLQEKIAFLKKVNPDNVKIEGGNLYKVDIPDEAVARFLDWDKPLSQQAPEVQAVLSEYKGVPAQGGEGWGKVAGKSVDRTGADIYLDISAKKGAGNRADQSATEYFKSLGIPGIRYLDGGSRSAGQGSSNFVLFDDRLPRILEINNQPTGLQPWKPGEWK